MTLLLALAMLANPDGGVPGPATLCAPDEVVAFSCSVAKQKLVSICASKDAGPTTGYVQYRFGRTAKLELTFPETHEPGAKNFSAARGHVQTFRFHDNDVEYVVFFGSYGGKWGVDPWSESGVKVYKGGAEISRLKCLDGGAKGGFHDSFDDDWLEAMGFPHDSKGLESVTGPLPR